MIKNIEETFGHDGICIRQSDTSILEKLKNVFLGFCIEESQTLKVRVPFMNTLQKRTV